MFERNFGENIVLVLYRKPDEEKGVCLGSVADLPHRPAAIFFGRWLGPTRASLMAGDCRWAAKWSSDPKDIGRTAK